MGGAVVGGTVVGGTVVGGTVVSGGNVVLGGTGMVVAGTVVNGGVVEVDLVEEGFLSTDSSLGNRNSNKMTSQSKMVAKITKRMRVFLCMCALTFPLAARATAYVYRKRSIS